MKYSSNVYLKLGLSIFIAVTLAFVSHVFIQNFTKPLLAAMAQGIRPSTGNYPNTIVITSYITAFIMVSIDAFLYYHAGHLLKISNKILKSLVVAFIMLESHGELIRNTLVGYLDLSRLGAHKPLFYIVLTQADKWIPNLILAFCIVYLCPLKHKNSIS